MRILDQNTSDRLAIVPPLEPAFRPAVLFNRAFLRDIEKAGVGYPIILGLERPDGSISQFETLVFPEDHPRAELNIFFCERILKFLLWQRGGNKIFVGGPKSIGDAIKKIYSPVGERSFDYSFMGEKVYRNKFQVIPCKLEEVPPSLEKRRAIGRHMDGCRVGFDLGASDLKISAVKEGKSIFSSEMEWDPKNQSDPNYHKQKVLEALKIAREKLPRLDAIGGSSAGVIIDNQPMVASLFRGIPEAKFAKVRKIFLEIKSEFGVPLEIANDGEVTALAGSMSMGLNSLLGIAMGSSEAAGYVTKDGNITNWLNELAFAPIDYNPGAPIDEWSGDRGCGVSYLSQQCVFRLAKRASIIIPNTLSNAQKLKFVQEKLEAGHEGAQQIWESMGYFMGYAIAHYADFYPLKNVLILGRCTSGIGGQVILERTNELIRRKFPTLWPNIQIHLPDELSRRVGQSIAAASLPKVQ